MSGQQEQMTEWQRDIFSRIEDLACIQKAFFEEIRRENQLLRDKIIDLTAERMKQKQELFRVQEEVKTIFTKTKNQIENQIPFSLEEKDVKDLEEISHNVKLLLDVKDISRKHISNRERYGKEGRRKNELEWEIKTLNDTITMHMRKIKEELVSKLKSARNDQEECQKIHLGQTVNLWRSLSNQLNDSVSKSIEKCFQNITSKSKITLLAGSERSAQGEIDAKVLYSGHTTEEKEVLKEQEPGKNVLQSESVTLIENFIASQESIYKELIYESRLLRDQLSSLSAEQEKVTRETISYKEEVRNIGNEIRVQIDYYSMLLRERDSGIEKNTFAFPSRLKTLMQANALQKDIIEQKLLGGKKVIADIPSGKKERFGILGSRKSSLKEFVNGMKTTIKRHRYLLREEEFWGDKSFPSESDRYRIHGALENIFIQQDIYMKSLKTELMAELQLYKLNQEECQKLHTEKTMKLWKELSPQVNYSVSKCIERCFGDFQPKHLLLADIKGSDATENFGNTLEVNKTEDLEPGKKEDCQGTDFDIRKVNWDWLNATSEESLATIYIKNYWWMTPLPNDDEFRVNLAEVYVEPDLRIIGPNLLESQNIKMENLFEPVSNDSSPIRRVLLIGDVGSGKSALCMKLALEWSLGTTTFISLPWNTTLLLFFELRKLSQGTNLESELINFIKPSLSHELARRDSVLVQKLRSLQRNLLVILDGYDELDSERQNEVKRFVSLKDDKLPFSESTILVCSRPSAADSDLLAKFDKLVTIESFSEEKLHWLLLNLNRHILPTEGEKKKQFHTGSHPQTLFVEQKLLAEMKKPMDLLTMSPLMISVLYWIVKKPRLAFGDVIYTCIEYLCRRCNEREGFGYNIQEIRDTLWTYGFLWIHTKQPFLSEEQLRKALGTRFSLLSLSGLIKRSDQGKLGEIIWESAQKSFIETIIERVFHSTEDEHLKIREMRQILENHFSSRIYGCKIRIHYSKDKNQSAYLIITSADGKMLFCKWDEIKESMSLAIQEFPRPDPVEIELSFWACSWPAIESIYKQMFLVYCARPHFAFLKTFNLREYTHWCSYSITFSYEEVSAECPDEVFCPGDKILISRLGNEESFKELKIHVKESSNNQHVVFRVMCRLFDAPIDQVPKTENPRFLFEYFHRLAQERGQYRLVSNVHLISGIFVSDFTNEDQEFNFTWEDIDIVSIKVVTDMSCRDQ